MNTKIGSVYKITCAENKKCYIGITIQDPPENRWRQHLFYDKDHYRDKLLFRAFEKYGRDKFQFEVICQTKDISDLKDLEKYFIRYYKSYCNRNEKDGTTGYNMTVGGDGVWGLKFSPESKLKCSSSQRERFLKNPDQIPSFKGHKHTNEAKNKTSKLLKEYYSTRNVAWKGGTQSPESNQKRSEALKGRKLTPQCHEAGRQKESMWWEITHPDGHKEEVFNMRAFCKQHHIDAQNLWKTAKGLIRQSKGYSAKKIDKPATFLL